MTRKTYPLSIVHEEQLESHGLTFQRVDPRAAPIVYVAAKNPHAIVRDKNGDDIGYIVYQSRNGLPYSEFDRNVRYMFWREDRITRTTKPEMLD